MATVRTDAHDRTQVWGEPDAYAVAHAIQVDVQQVFDPVQTRGFHPGVLWVCVSDKQVCLGGGLCAPMSTHQQRLDAGLRRVYQSAPHAVGKSGVPKRVSTPGAGELHEQKTPNRRCCADQRFKTGQAC